MADENRNYVIAGVFVAALHRAGLRHVCLCPGSRSTPLTISFDREDGIRKWWHLDERSAGFFALGMAKRLGEPVALVCSSGTAAANFLPAVVEARFSSVPLLVLTADRPPELIDQGALQTIDQTHLYGSHAKWFAAMPTPEATPALVQHARAMAARAFATALAAPAGPVHLNFPFREPLEPKAVPEDLKYFTDFRDTGPVTVVAGKPAAPPEDALRALAGKLEKIERGLIICGPGPGGPSPAEVTGLAKKLGWPVLADCLSGVRCGSHDRDLVIDDYDAFIAAAPAELAPETVLRFGAVPVSKPLLGFLEKHRPRQVLIDGGAGWREPNFLGGEVWQADADLFCAGLEEAITAQRNPGEWVRHWRAAAATTRAVIREQIDGFDGLFEGRVFSELSELLPDGSILFAGNSMPVRDLDTFFPSSSKGIGFLANRGASGIDGVTSTALGVAAAAGKRVALVLGDISFYHDLNGLLAARAFGLDATIIVLNNNGGGIFSFLPQAAYEETFERCFGTPHGLTFKSAADLYCLDYVKTEDWPSFRENVTASLGKAGTMIIEVPGDRTRNAARHRQVREAAAAALKGGGR